MGRGEGVWSACARGEPFLRRHERQFLLRAVSARLVQYADHGHGVVSLLT